MADKLIFPIGFDLEAAVKKAEAEGEKALRRMEGVFSRQPLVLKTDTRGFAELGHDIDTLKGRLKEIQTQWEKMPTAAKFDLDSEGRIKQLTADGKALWDELLRINTALQGVGQGLMQFANQSNKALQEEARFAELMREAEIRRHNESARARLKEQTDDEKRYQKWLSNKEKEVQKEQEAAQKKQNAQERAANAARKAQREAEVEAYRVNAALKAQEDVLSNLTAKYNIYQQQIRGQQIGTEAWNKTALEIRRINEELQKANQQMQDFQQKAFQGLSDSLTKGKVEALTRLREQLRQVEADFNRLNQTGGAYKADNTLTSAANDILRQREAIIKQINQMLTTAADAQIQREKEINRIVEERNAKHRAELEAQRRKSAETERQRKALAAEENTIAGITAKLQAQNQRLRHAEVGSKPFEKAAKEVERLTKKLDEANRKIGKLSRSTASGASLQASAVRQVTNEFKNQDGYVSRLVKRLVVYAGWERIRQFLIGVREVTAEFELQRVSLGAIIQDQTRANALFSEIKSFALKSPVSILDLTKYTKQLAAYKIGVDELFETTKKLTDVSVGLGVSMDRVVLAYGQTRATGYLRASEIRQFTEMGVPIVEELAAKLSKMNGELVTAAQVMDMVSKRAISFELVKEVFDDMTSAGGMFYNMQEKQGNTLYGMWAKLGDAASVMYDEIGNTEGVNSAMKTTIQLLTDLMKNWRSVWRNIATAAVGFGIFKTGSALIKMMAVDSVAAAAASRQFTRATIQHRAAIAASNPVMEFHTNMLRRIAVWNKTAALSTNLMTVAWNKLKVAMVTWGPMAIVAGIGMLVNKIITAHENANRLKNTLKEIAEESGVEQMKSVRNFESLANMAVNAADGSRKQKEALDELSRTYKDIIPQERLTIENLRNMKGNYDSLTESIKNYVAEQMKQKQVNAVVETTGAAMIENSRKFQEAAKDIWNYEQTARFMSAYERIIRDNPVIATADAIKQAATEIGLEWGKVLNLDIFSKGKLSKSLYGFADALKEQVNQIDALEVAWNNNYAALGKYGNGYAELVNKIKDNPIAVGGSPDIDEQKTPYLFKQQQQNLEILQAMIPTLKKIMSDAGVVWQDGWANIVTTIDKAQPQIISSIDFNAINQYLKDNLGLLTDEQRKAINKVRNMYDDMIPSNRTTVALRAKLAEISTQTGVSMDVLRNHLINAGESWEDYSKRVRDAIKKYEKQIEEMNKANASVKSGNGAGVLKTYTDEEIKKTGEYAEALKLLLPFLEALKGGGRDSHADTRLQTLNEIEQTLTKINQKYEELLKKEGQTKALTDIRKIYGDTLAYINKLGDKFGLAFEMPTDFKTLQDYRKSIQKVIETLKMKGYEKAALELQTKIDTGDIDQLGKQIEQKLKDLSDRISRTKTAREFYDKILSQTGSYDIAGSVTFSIYGDDGQNLLRDTIEQLQMAFENVDISAAIDLTTGAIDYNMLRKFEKEYSDKLISGRKDLRDKLISEGEKASAAQVAQWYKDIEKAKDYNQQYVDIVRETQTKIAEIRRSGLDKDVEDELVKGMEEKQRKALKKLQLDEFRSSDLYVRLFEDMDSASTTMLQSLKDKLDDMKKTMREDLTPAELKSLTQDIEKLEDVLQQRNPFQTITKGLKGLRQWHKENGSLADAEKKLTDAIAEEAAAREQWEADTQAAAKAQAELNAALQQYQAIAAVKGEDSEEAQTAKANVDAKRDEANAATNTAKKSEEAYKSAKQTKDEAQETVRSWEEWVDSMREGLKVFGQIEGIFSDMTDAANNFMDVFAASDETRQFFDDVLGGLNSIIGGAEKAATGMLDAYSGFMSANPMQMIQGGMSAISGLSSIAKGVTDIFYAGRIKKANKEIKRQQEILDQLEYTYGRLEKAAERLFGKDYLNSYNQQLRNLQAQAEAYQKQAEAERSKGKKADKDKIKEYENAYRETMDEIADMESDLTAKLTGTSRADAAREFAQSWIEAKASYASTLDAMQSKYQEMLKNMIVEGAAAKVIDSVLAPMWEQMDRMLADNDITGAIDYLVNGMDSFMQQADDGMNVLWEALEARGYDMQKLLGEADSSYTGIKREVAGATSEEMNANTAALNAQTYYLSQMPGIAANVALLTQHIVNGVGGAIPTATAGVDFGAYHTESLAHMNTLTVHTAGILAECKQLNLQTKNIADALGRVVVYKGNSHGIRVLM